MAKKFDWPTLREDAIQFVRGCLHCMVVGERVVPRLFGEAVHTSAPTEVLHFDFLSLPASTIGDQYVLVLRDDMRDYCELIACENATVVTACQGMLD